MTAKPRSLVPVLLAVLCASITVSATTLVRMSLDQLTQASDAVVQGHVLSQVSQWNAAHTQILTLTTIAVDSNVKGNTSSTIVVQQLGGTVGHFRVYVPDTVHFFPESKYMLFLEHSPSSPGEYRPVGMVEGAYRIYRDQQTGQERVINPVGYYFSRASGNQVSAVPETMPLNVFQQKVSSSLAKPVAIPSGAAIPLVIVSTSFNGVGRMLVEGQTTADVFPNSQVAVPAGSVVDGWASESAGKWVVHWTSVSVRGRQLSISAANQASSGQLQGKRLTAVTR